MNIPLLFSAFSSAITANALLYLLAKICSTATTFLLYATLLPTDFAIWATAQSFIYLMLLWLDFGLRKSIPRYALSFIITRRRLLFTIIPLYLTLLIGASPFILYGLSWITTNYFLLLSIMIIYLAEGTTNILRSLYHAYFYHRFFNQLSAIMTLIDMSCTVIIVFYGHPSQILLSLFLAKCITTTALVSITVIQWHHQPPPLITSPTPCERIPFIKYSLCMWSTTLLTSISERNFLLPFIIAITGIATGNLFKVAHDGALLFYRLIIKTIGSTDTALLAHAQMNDRMMSEIPGEDNLMQQSVQKLSTQMTRLVLPLLGIIFCIIPIGYWFYHDHIVFHAFLIMAIGYIMETIWIPYERVLEVHENYIMLGIIYSIYTISIACVFFLFYTTWIGLISFLICIHGVRLVIGILMRYSVYHIYRM